MSSRLVGRLLVSIVGIAVFLFVLLKAQGSSFTHDESFSYLHYVDDSFMELLSYADAYTNNHILNSIGMKYSEMLFGSSELALRLPNVLLCAVYLIYALLLLRNLHLIVLCASFILLATHQPLMDLFGLARGYGLSCGFMLMSLFHYFRMEEGPQRKHLIIFHGAALLAILSNFTLLIYYVALLLVHNVTAMLTPAEPQPGIARKLIAANRAHVIPFLISVGILYEPVRRLITYNALDFGGKEGFFESTVASLITISRPEIAFTSSLMLIAQLAVALILVLGFVVILRKWRERDIRFFAEQRALVILNILILLMVAIIVAQHILLGADYPVGRFAVFLFPIYIIHFGFLVDYFLHSKFRSALLGGLSALALFSLVSFVLRVDLKKAGEWGYDSETKTVIELITKHHQDNNGGRKMTLGTHWLFEPTSNFYRVTRGLDWLEPIEREDSQKSGADYWYLLADDLQQFDTHGYTEIVNFKEAGTILLKRLEEKKGE